MKVPNVSNLALAILIVLTLIVIMASQTYAQYKDIFQAYEDVTTPEAIGPLRIVMGYERPFIASIVLTKPVGDSVALFLILAIRYKSATSFQLVSSFGTAQQLEIFAPITGKPITSDFEAVWRGDVDMPNPLAAMPWNVQYDAPIVKSRVENSNRDLEMLWLTGLERFARYKFSDSATSVSDVWNDLFSTVPPVSSNTTNNSSPDTCPDGYTIAGSVGSGALGMGLAGAAIGGPFGFLLGAAAGAAAGLFQNNKCIFKKK